MTPKRRLHPVAEAALQRIKQGAARAGAKGLAAVADVALEEGEELLEEVGRKALAFGERLRDARRGRAK